MRALAIVFALLPVACDDSSAGGSPTTDGSAVIADGGGDAYDAPSYDSEDFSKFRYFWGGTGMSGSFNMDRDCGIEAGGHLSYVSPEVPSGAGVVAEADCNSFKSLVVSNEVLDALAKYATPGTLCPGGGTDDYTSMTVSLTEGPDRSISMASGCTGAEPFSKVSKEAVRLANKYITPTDAGTD